MFNFRWHPWLFPFWTQKQLCYPRNSTGFFFYQKRINHLEITKQMTKAESVDENYVYCFGANALKHWLVFVYKIKTCLVLCLSLNSTVSLIFTFISVGCVHGIWAWKVSRSVTTIVKCYSLIFFLLLIWNEFYFGYFHYFKGSTLRHHQFWFVRCR